MGGTGKGSGNVAIAHLLHGQRVGRRLEPYARGVGCNRLAAVGHDRQRLVVDIDQRSGVFGNAPARGDHDRDGLTYKADLVAGKHEGRNPRRPTGSAHHGGHPGTSEPWCQIVQGVYRRNACQGTRCRTIDASNTCMRMTAAHEHGMQHPRRRDVIDVAPATEQEVAVFDAGDACADPALCSSRLSGGIARGCRRPYRPGEGVVHAACRLHKRCRNDIMGSFRHRSCARARRSLVGRPVIPSLPLRRATLYHQPR